MVRIDGTDVRRLTTDGAVAGSPAWSADGKRLAFYSALLEESNGIVSPMRLRGTTQIETIDLESGKREALTSGAGEKWSPQWLSATQVGYASGGPEGGIERTGGAAGVRGEFRNPQWSADGKRLVFQRDVDSRWPPHRPWHTLDPQFRLTRTGVFPVGSPSGNQIVSMDRTAGILHNSLLIMNADGSHRSVLFTHPEKSAVAPAWSPVGDRIAFSFGQFFQMTQGVSMADIAVVGTDGSGLKILTDDQFEEATPGWTRAR